MSEYDDILYSAHNSLVEDEDFWETVYPEGYRENGLTDEKPHEKEECYGGGDAEETERLMWLNEVLNDGSVQGEGSGVEITGVVAALLGNADRYGFEFHFFRVDEPTPWE